jgi:thiosulfate/3-mercaptopyruvate sulfurtransferase
MKSLSSGLIGLLLLGLSSLALANPSYLVDSMWLEDHIDDPNVVVLEVRYYAHRYYTVGHIPGARQVQRFKDLGDNFAEPMMRFPDHKAFQETLRSWGVNKNSTVVLYDDSRTALASRLYFMLALYGFNMEQVKVLNGGTLEWSAMNDMSTEAPEVKRGNVRLKPADPKMLVEWTDIYDDVVSRRDENIILLDARPKDQYTGERINGAIRGGHIPGAINIVSLDATDSISQKWRDDSALEGMYANLPRDKTYYVYCHDGFRQTLTWMQLKHLGFKDVRLYNGGWAHWGNALSLPVVNGEQPFDANFEL